MSSNIEISDIDANEELFTHYQIKADPGQEPFRLDKFLMNRIEHASRSKIQAAAKLGNILVNDIPQKSNYKVKSNDIITVLFAKPIKNEGLIAEDIPIDVVYEDEHLVIINKTAGMVVHPGVGNRNGTLVNALIYHFEHISKRANDRPGLVHRLDKDTTGLLVVAKDDITHDSLAKQFFDRTVERTYLALTWGSVEQTGRIEGNIGRHPRHRKQMFVFKDGEDGKYAATNYELIEDLGYVSLIRCKLETGRTHQIRVHMKSIGNTLFNDEQYGGDQILKGTVYTKYRQFVQNCFQIMPRMALHANTLGFIHPVTKKKMQFEQALPQEFEQLLEKWRTYMVGRTQ